MNTKNSRNLNFIQTDIGLDQLQAPLAVVSGGVLSYGNQAFHELFPLNSLALADIRKNEIIHQIATEIQLLGETMPFDFAIGDKTYHCLASPVKDRPNQIVILFEDISAAVRSEKDNNLLYRLSILLNSTNQPLKKTLQTVIDQVLFELDIFDASILLFSKMDGKLHPTAWGTTNLNSRILGKFSFELGQGIAGKVAQTLRPIVVPDIFHEPTYIKETGDNRPLSLLCAPIANGGEILGVMNLTRSTQKGFGDSEVQLITIIAGKLGALIRTVNVQQIEECQNQLTQLIISSPHLLEYYGNISESITNLLQVDTCFVLEWDSENHTTKVQRSRGGHGLSAQILTQLQKFIENYKQSLEFDKRQWVIFDNSLPHFGHFFSANSRRAIEGGVLFPVVVRHESFGYLFIKNSLWSRRFTPNDLTVGHTIASQLAVSLENAQANEVILDERKKLQQIQNTLHDGIILFTPDMKIAMYNLAAKRLLGIKKDISNMPWESVLNRDIDDFCRYRLIRHYDPIEYLRLAIEEGKTSTGQGFITSHPPKIVEITVAPVYDRRDKISGVLSHLRDITQVHDLQTKMGARVEQLTDLFKISSVTGFNSQQIVRRVLRLIIHLLSVKASQLLLTDPDRIDHLKLIETVGEIELSDNLKKRLYRKATWVVEHAQPTAHTVRLHADQQPVHILITPVLGHHQACIGALLVIDKQDHHYFTREDINLLSIVSTQIATKLDNAWLMNQTESDRNKLAAIIDQSVDGIFVLNTDREVEIWNPALERLTGVKEEEVKDRSMNEVRELTHTLESKDIGSVREVKIQHPQSGQLTWLGVTYAPLKNGDELTGQIAIVRDISRQKELEQLKNEFVSTASHELRSPITAIVGYLSMLRRGDAGQVINKQQAFFVEKAYQNSKRMVGLIEDLLMTTRMETGQLRYHIEPIRITDLIDNVLTDLSFRAEEKNITVSCHKKEQLWVMADKDGLHQVLSNVITNAIKYTPGKGKVQISFDKTSNDNQPRLVTIVKDTGVGIDSADQAKIFEKFSRIDNPLSVSAGGTGLGLYITKSIVEEMGGEIWLKSQKDKGSTFYISLPISKQFGKERKV